MYILDAVCKSKMKPEWNQTTKLWQSINIIHSLMYVTKCWTNQDFPGCSSHTQSSFLCSYFWHFLTFYSPFPHWWSRFSHLITLYACRMIQTGMFGVPTADISSNLQLISAVGIKIWQYLQGWCSYESSQSHIALVVFGGFIYQAIHHLTHITHRRRQRRRSGQVDSPSQDTSFLGPFSHNVLSNASTSIVTCGIVQYLLWH